MQKLKLGDAKFVLILGLTEVRAVRKKLAIDLLTRDGIAQACESLADFAEVLFVVLGDQVEEAGFDQSQFDELVLTNAELCVDTFLKELGDFFRRCGKAALAQLATAIVETTRESDRMAAEMLDDATTRRLTSGTLRKEQTTRRRHLDRILAELDANDAPGETSPN